MRSVESPSVSGNSGAYMKGSRNHSGRHARALREDLCWRGFCRHRAAADATVRLSPACQLRLGPHPPGAYSQATASSVFGLRSRSSGACTGCARRVLHRPHLRKIRGRGSRYRCGTWPGPGAISAQEHDPGPRWPGLGAVMKPLGARPLGRFARPRRRLRAGLLRLLCAVAGLVLGLLLPGITVASTVASTRVLDALMAVGFGVPGPGEHHLLAAFPGCAVGLRQPVALRRAGFRSHIRPARP